MKGFILLVLTILLVAVRIPAQPSGAYREADRRARRAPAAIQGKLPGLTAWLTEGAAGDFARVRAIYSWITANIQYDEAAYRDGRGRINREPQDILRRRRGVCFDYAVLFSAMCREAGINSSVVSGYCRTSPEAAPNMTEPDHAWNAVEINGEWRLLDATWGRNYAGVAEDPFFLPAPEDFVQRHLPVVPMWQLLDNPVSAADFSGAAIAENGIPVNKEAGFRFQDSIRQWQALPEHLRRLREAEGAWRFHPVEANRAQLGHAWMDYAAAKSDSLERLHDGDGLDSLIELGKEVIDACSRAESLLDSLYPWQRELYAGALINQGVALYRKVYDAPSTEAKPVYRNILNLLARALAIVDKLPPDSLYAPGARERCEEYIAVVKEMLDP